MVLRAAGVVLALSLCACADFGEPLDGDGGGRRSSEQQRYQELDARVTELTRKVDNLKAASPAQAITRLEADLRELRGEIETLRNNADQREKRARDLYQDLDRRIQRVENESRAPKLSLEPKIQEAPPVPASQEEEAAYVQAFEQLKNGSYDEALAGFKNQLEHWPDGRFAVNALYWSGEAQAAKKDFEAAKTNFQALLDRFPKGDKAPDARFKLGVAEWELKNKDAAKAAWQKVMADYPQSNAAGLAKQRLDSAK